MSEVLRSAIPAAAGPCAWCRSAEPGQHGFRAVSNGVYHMSRHDCRPHPLRQLFMARAFPPTEGMNWLQERGLISDLCVEVEHVALVDAARVLEMAKRTPHTNIQ